MKLPLKWLKEYVDFNVTPEDFAERMLLRGFEAIRSDDRIFGRCFISIVFLILYFIPMASSRHTGNWGPIGHFAGYNMPAAPTNTGLRAFQLFGRQNILLKALNRSFCRLRLAGKSDF